MSLRSIIEGYIELLKTKMNSEEFIYLNKNDHALYEKKLEEFVPIFKEEHEKLFKMIINSDDLTYLYKMLNALDDVGSGKKTMNEVRQELGVDLDKKYVSGLSGQKK